MEAPRAQGRPPQTLDELVHFAQAGTTGDTWGYVDEGTNKESAYFWNFQYFHNNGADFFNQDLTANGFNNDGGLAALQFVTDLFTKYKVTPALGAYTQDQQKDLFKGGKALVLQHEITRLGDFEISNLAFQYDGFLSPKGTVAPTSFGNYGYFLISEASQHKEESWNFIRYFTSADVLGPYAEAHGFLLMRKDYETFKNDLLKKRILDMVAPAGTETVPLRRRVRRSCRVALLCVQERQMIGSWKRSGAFFQPSASHAPSPDEHTQNRLTATQPVLLH